MPLSQSTFLIMLIKLFTMWYWRGACVSFLLGIWHWGGIDQVTTSKTRSRFSEVWPRIFWSHVWGWLDWEPRLGQTSHLSPSRVQNPPSSQSFPLCSRGMYVDHVGPFLYKILNNILRNLLGFFMKENVKCEKFEKNLVDNLAKNCIQIFCLSNFIQLNSNI